MVQRSSHLRSNQGRQRWRDPRALPPSDNGTKVQTVDKFHRDIGPPPVLANLIDVSDIGVIETDGDPRFVKQHVEEHVIGGEVGQDALDDSQTLSTCLALLQGKKHLCHPSCSNLEQKFIPTYFHRIAILTDVAPTL